MMYRSFKKRTRITLRKLFFWKYLQLINDAIRAKNLQEFINSRFSSKDQIVININNFDIIRTKYNMLFHVNGMISSIDNVETDYLFDDIKKTDIVLDIGACIGGFSLKVCKNVSKVFAVEPLEADELRKNIMLNNIENITVIESALGPEITHIEWGNIKTDVKGMSLTELINLCGGHVDFLKIDCEGGEWNIKTNELKGIRRIEAEVHDYEKDHGLEKFLKILEDSDHKYRYTILIPDKLMLVHAYAKEVDGEIPACGNKIVSMEK